MTTHSLRKVFSLDLLIAEAKRRARHRRLLIGLSLAVVVAGLAVTLGLPGGSSGGPGMPGASDSLTGSRARANQARLERGGPVRLLPGLVSTDALGTHASFQVARHWYGEQGPGIVRLARQLATGGLEVGLDRGGIEVETLDSTLARSVRRLESAAGIHVHDVSPVRIGGHPGRRYSLSSDHLFELRPGNNLGVGEQDVILLGVRHGTLVIKNIDAVVPNLIPDHEQERREAERVIQSFRFQS